MKIESTRVPNLVRDTEWGTYYARVKVQGRLVVRSLDTKRISTARARLNDKLEEIREELSDLKEAQLDPKTSFRTAFGLYKGEVELLRLKPTTKVVRLRSEKLLLRHWPKIFDMELRQIDEDMLKKFLHRFENGGSEYLPSNAKSKTRPGDSPTTVNTLISFLTHIFDIGVKAKIVRRNPAMALKRMPPSQKVMDLPNRTQWAAMVARIRKGAGWGTKTADLVEGLAYSGMRVGEARSLEWGHIDWERNQFVIYPEKSRPRTNPMVEDFRTLLLRIKGDRQPQPAEKVFQCQEATMSLAKASALVGKPRMTHHDLRHLFATNCIEQGVDIPTLSKWLGHRDGGALAMRTYINVRTDHGVQAAKKVSFK